ncbi:nitrate reductase subunit alpha [Geobacter sp.]|uniref:nitrate reductase subunit alpha n=1 Tax=Geobacter sp. TaxID=46610 RepID=UPI00263A1973|nr:nitrate reductase subunit alpha [Geobacter sp.]
MAHERIKDDYTPAGREWEEFYRNRYQYDKVVRSTHGVNCTGSCSWMVHVKDGIVCWELQANDYPQFNGEIPNHEPRGCTRGISFSWYLYSPMRVKYPYVRGPLLDLWQKARERFADPVEAWRSIVEDPEARKSYTSKRGMGGLRRASWEEVVELIAASAIHTARKHGPDRVIGFSPIPAMSMISYAAGTRFLQLFGGVAMSFYDWYCDLPPASPQIWGEQTDVNESADWYNATNIVLCGANVPMTRTPDSHYLVEARYRGAKVTVISPDYNIASKFADTWLPVAQGHDGAFWMAVNHVLLTECYANRQVPFFEEYARKFTDLPFLVKLDEKEGAWQAGEQLRAAELPRGAALEHAEWLLCVADEAGEARIPNGSLGTRWSKAEGNWNLDMRDLADGSEIACRLSFLGGETRKVRFRFEGAGEVIREVPVRRIKTAAGEATVVTVYDLLMAQFGVSRGLGGDYPKDYDSDRPFTPAWQEKYTGIGRETLIRFAREWAENGEASGGRNMVIVGAGINHWYHNDLIYRAAITALILTGSVGRNGAGLAHYVGQEKVVPLAPWTTIAMAQDWVKPSRLQNTPSFWYIHSDQWRYDRSYVDYFRPETGEKMPLHSADMNAKAVRLGWLPFAPHFNDSPLRLVERARAAGAVTDEEIRAWMVGELKSGQVRFAIEDPDAPGNSPKVWFIWRANALSASAKGHEYFLKHILGAPNAACTARELAKGEVKDIVWHEEAPEAKVDLVIDLNFRMDTSAVYSDIVLPAATWYEKSDLNTTDMHSFVNCMDAAVPPSWESKSDWQTFALIAKKVSELAPRHFPEPVKDVIAAPLLHDTPGEIAQRRVQDWKLGECEPLPGKTMPNLAFVERDYVNLYNRFASLGPGIGHLHAHGVSWEADDVHERLLKRMPTRSWKEKTYIDLADEKVVADVILAFAPESNGELAHRAYENLEKRVGKPLTPIAAGSRDFRMSWEEITQKPRRYISTPVWSGLVNEGRPYSPYTLNVEYGVPWRTLSGRQSLYLDHPYYTAFNEGLPTFKAKLDQGILGETTGEEGLVLNFLTPHGKWSIHSTYSDNLRMLTLSRAGQVVWLNHEDAAGAGIADNDEIELFNTNGVVVCRAVVSARIPKGAAIMYHAPERTLNIQKSRKNGRRGGVHNSLSRILLKPTLMLGGYAQFSWYFNYWGPTGVNRDCYVVVRKLER